MILQKFSEKLRSQDWFTVTLEVAILVIGIFLGLQADAWNQDRMAKAELDTYYQSLTQELSNTVDIRRDHIRWEEKIIIGLKNTLGALEGQKLDDDARDHAYKALFFMAAPPNFPQKVSVLMEMQSNGMFRLIDNPNLRQSLGEIVSKIHSDPKEHQRYVDAIDSRPFSPQIVQYMLNEDGRVRVANVDWEAAKMDPNFRHRVIQGIATYQAIIQSNERAVIMHNEALKMLANLEYVPSKNWLKENLHEVD